MKHLAAAPALALALLACTAPTASSGEQRAAVDGARQDAEAIGSLRNARVAIERGPGAATLTYFAGRLDEDELRELERAAPNVRIVAGLSQEEALRRAAEAHAADGRYATPEFLRAATSLAWIQAGSAGVERYLALPELAEDERIVLTNLRAVHGPAIADHVFAMLLALTRDLPVHLEGRAEGRWRREGSGELEPIALQGRTLLVVGLGGIGSEVARRAHGFGMRVLATRRSDAPRPPFVERVGPPEALVAMLAEADVVVLCVPLTDETRGLIDREALDAMPRGGYLVNIARGAVVDTGALLAALRSGHLAGACLDVTDPEPLPPDHELWRLPNVVITPHVAARAALTRARGRELLRENLRRFDASEPLLNVVDKQAGY